MFIIILYLILLERKKIMRFEFVIIKILISYQIIIKIFKEI
jgi:hypothetical protein